MMTVIQSNKSKKYFPYFDLENHSNSTNEMTKVEKKEIFVNLQLTSQAS